jgi:uncharacterized protein (TIRG00374 family)
VRRRPSRWRPGRVVVLSITAFCLYLLAPSIGEVFAASSRLGDVRPIWLVPATLCAVGTFACLWIVQVIVLGTHDWFAVITTQLAANAFNRITPGGGATGTVLQASMLTSAGFDSTQAATAVAVQSVLSTAALVALPLFCIPFIVFGTQVPSGLLSTMWIGIPVFVLMVVIGLAAFAFDAPLRWLACVIAWTRHRLGSGATSGRTLADRFLQSRDAIRRDLEPRWKLAVGTSVLRWFLEFGVVVATLFGLSADPDPALTLLAFAAASVLGLLPFTPGGLGFVEAGLAATLALAGVSPADAVVTTLVYRLLTFWLPLPVGAVAAVLYRRRYPKIRDVETRRV